MAICRCHAVGHNLSEGVSCAHLQEKRASSDGQHRVVHEGVVPGKLDDIIRELLGGPEGAKGLAGALARAERGAHTAGKEV